MLKYYYTNLFLICLGSSRAVHSKALPVSLLLLAPCCFCYCSLKVNFSNHIYLIFERERERWKYACACVYIYEVNVYTEIFSDVNLFSFNKEYCEKTTRKSLMLGLKLNKIFLYLI